MIENSRRKSLQGVERCDTGTCLETVRSGDYYYLLDTKDYSSGPMAVLDQEEYGGRLEKVVSSGDSGSMFDNQKQRETLTAPELEAHAAYAVAGRLGNLADRQQVIAYADLRDLAQGGVLSK